jgi:hypothetical protein
MYAMSVEPEDVAYARGRRTDRTYLSRSFPLGGEWARYVIRVFDEPADWIERDDFRSALEWTEEIMRVTPGGRRQLKFQVARMAGHVRQIDVEQIQTIGGAPHLQRILRLDREAARRFIDLVAALDLVPVVGGERGVRIDDETLREFFADPDAISRLYQTAPDRFRDLIRSDASAADIVALAHRRAVVARMRQLLTDPDEFSKAQATAGGKPEAVWQRLLEQHPWILGLSLAGQLLQSWDDRKLEQVVAGSSVAGPGKRADALLRTTGRIRSLVFAEIKHHETRLLGGREYRSGCWPPSAELVGGVTPSPADRRSRRSARRTPIVRIGAG